MARLLNDKVRRKEAAMYWTRACCKQKTAMGGRRRCCHEYCLSGYRLRLCEGVCNDAVECLSELLRQCDTSTIKTRRQPHSRVRHLIPTPRINAELSEELPTEAAMVDSKASLLGLARSDTMVGVIEERVAGGNRNYCAHMAWSYPPHMQVDNLIAAVFNGVTQNLCLALVGTHVG